MHIIIGFDLHFIFFIRYIIKKIIILILFVYSFFEKSKEIELINLILLFEFFYKNDHMLNRICILLHVI